MVGFLKLYQINFIEGSLKEVYFPRELIIKNLKDSEGKLKKNYGNKMVNIPYIISPNHYKFHLIFPNKSKNALSFFNFLVVLIILSLYFPFRFLGFRRKKCPIRNNPQPSNTN